VSWFLYGVRFACEIATIVAVVWWGWPLLGIGAGLAVIVAWGAWVASKSARRLPDPARLVGELGIFGLARVAFARVGESAIAAGFAWLRS
jgi:hypothetical protein